MPATNSEGRIDKLIKDGSKVYNDNIDNDNIKISAKLNIFNIFPYLFIGLLIDKVYDKFSENYSLNINSFDYNSLTSLKYRILELVSIT